MSSDQVIKRVPIEDLQDFEGRSKHLFTIQTKDGENKNFTFLQSQKYFNDIVESEFERTKGELGSRQCRIIALKPRQVGWTTYSNIKSLDMQLYSEGSNGVIAAHDQDTTEKIYNIYKRAYNNLPDYVIPTVDDQDMSRREYVQYMLEKAGKDTKDIDLSAKDYNETQKIKIKPTPETYSGKRIGFKETDSMTTIFTAGKGDTGGLGGTVRRVHLSESANFSKYKDLLQALNPSVPKFSDDVFYIIESTANGTTGDGEGFYKAWNNAVKGWEAYQEGKSQTYNGFRPVFIPWYMFDEYELPLAGGKYESIDQIDFGSPEEKRKFLEKEKTLLEDGIFNPLTKKTQILTPEKINWYRFIIKTDCEYDYKAAQRFYPTTPEEAFVASSHCFFDAYKLNQRKTKLLNESPEYEVGELEWSDDADDLVFKPDGMGNLTIYAPPEPDWENRYVIGADIAKGREDGDYSVAYVFDRMTQQFVACYYGRVDQDVFADILMELGIFYNEALINPERNMSMVVELIRPEGLTPYLGELYYVENNRSIQYGYWTGGGESGSRNILLNTHKKFLRENALGYDALPDIDAVDEHISFVRKQTNTGVKYEADEGAHDDRVISASLAIIADQWWEEPPKKYKPNKITEILKKPSRRKTKFIKQYQLGQH